MNRTLSGSMLFLVSALTLLPFPSLCFAGDQKVLIIQVPGLGDDDTLGWAEKPGFDGWAREEARKHGWPEPVGIDLPHDWSWVPRLVAERTTGRLPKWEQMVEKDLRHMRNTIQTFLAKEPEGEVLIVTHSAGCSVFKPMSKWAKQEGISERITFLLNSPQAAVRTLNEIVEDSGVRLFTAHSDFDALDGLLGGGGSEKARYISLSIQDRCADNHSVMVLDTETVLNLSVNGRSCYGTLPEYWKTILDVVLGQVPDLSGDASAFGKDGNRGVFPGGYYIPITTPRSRMPLRRLLGYKDDDKPVKEDAAGNSVRSTETKDESGNPITGVEAEPVVARLLGPALIGQIQWRRNSAVDIRNLLPTSGPPATIRVGPFPVDHIMTMSKYAVEAAASEFRVDQRFTTTKAVALVTKTQRMPYEHDYPICPRFHLNSLENIAAVPLSLGGNGSSDAEEAWFWFSIFDDKQSRSVEVGCHFVVFVNEPDRELTVDSRWVDKQYSPYWRSPVAEPYDYILNFQVWSYNVEEAMRLVRSVLQRLEQLPGGWDVSYANQEQPTTPTVFIEEAWLAGDTVHLLVWNRSWLPVMACFHGTKQLYSLGDDLPLKHWEPVYPGQTLLQLPLGQMHNAVIHCEAHGFVDKLFVSVDRRRRAPQQQIANPFAQQRILESSSPEIKIMWPPDGARVRILRDQLDMPEDDTRLAIYGTVSGAPAGSRIEVFVYTTEWYKQETPVVKNGLWGTGVYLSGGGASNDHRLYARLVDQDGNVIAKDEVKGIVRIDEGPGGRGRLKPIVIEGSQFGNRRGVSTDADAIIIGGGPNGPYTTGGSASCEIRLPEDAANLKLRLSIRHGTPQQFGKGLHSKRPGGTATISINGKVVYTITCRHRHLYGDYWPEQQPELGRLLPEIDCQAEGITGRTVTIKIETSSYTCMDLRTLNVEATRR